MYCRKCLKKGKKINMNVELVEQCYICPECKNIVIWATNTGYYDLEEYKKK